jgi:hypothetical protein
MLNLSFPPGDLHLSQNEQGFFVLTLAGRELLKTKSQRSAAGKFHSLRKELEKLFPTHEPTATEKSELLRREIADHSLEHGSRKGTTRISPSALFEVEVALREYYTALEATDLTPSSQGSYLDQADRFVRWLRGDFDPGCRNAPYRAKKVR